MRLARLDLVRYGRFTDHALVFGDRPATGSDLHIVYGPNEAGKSTALAGFLDLLFGIADRSPYDFLHPYATMRVGALLENTEGVRTLARVKQRANSLLDGSGRPVSESVLAAMLGGIDRSAYQTMFCLDDATIEAGGDSILESKGDLGQLLFSASAGLADLNVELTKLRAQADGFYKRLGRSGELIELNAELARLKADREGADILASRYAQLIEARDRASQQYEETVAAQGDAQGRLDAIRRILGALPRLVELRTLRAALAALGDVPQPPEGWTERLPALRDAAIEAATLLDSLADETATLEAARDAIVLDEPALAHADRLTGLDALRPRAVTAEKDLPERRIALREAERDIAAILARIGREGEADPKRLVIPAPVTGPLRTLIERLSGVERALAAASEEVRRAAERHEAAKAKLLEAGGAETGATDGLAGVATALAALRDGDRRARRRSARHDCERLAALRDDRLAALKPWSGDAEALAALDPPDPRRLDQWDAALAAAGRQAESCRQTSERLASEVAGLEAQLAALSTRTEIVDDDEAARIRAARESAWSTHRTRLDATTADTFEDALRRDDGVQGARLSQAGTLATMRRDQQALALRRLDRDEARTRTAEAQVRLSEAEDAVVSAWRGLGGPDAPAAEALVRLRTWHTRYDSALQTRTELRTAEHLHREAEAEAAASRDGLVTSLAASGIALPADRGEEALAAAAQTAIDREAIRAGLRTQAAERADDLRERERLRDLARADRTAWDAEWAALCDACWLGESETTRLPAAARAVLDAIGDLAAKIEARGKLADRIDKMERDVAEFAREACALATALGLDASAGAPHDLARAAEDRIRRAQNAQVERDATVERLAKARERRRALEETRAVDRALILEMTRHFGVADLRAVEGKLRDARERAHLGGQAQKLEMDIVAATALPSLAEAEALLDAAQRPALESELSILQTRLADLDRRRLDLHAEHVKAADQVAAVGGDDAVARIEERRRTLLLTIEHRAERYLRLRIGTAAAEHALRAYRNRHRSAMMEAASHAFAAISRGAYTGLTTQPDRDGETLIAIAADGRSKRADALSKGTRFQLYLALRLAGYRELAKARDVVPFIADDILETSDNDRSEEAIRLFLEISRIGQVIYFTHHRHLCDIARRVAPEATIHDLAAV